MRLSSSALAALAILTGAATAASAGAISYPVSGRASFAPLSSPTAQSAAPVYAGRVVSGYGAIYRSYGPGDVRRAFAERPLHHRVHDARGYYGAALPHAGWRGDGWRPASRILVAAGSDATNSRGFVEASGDAAIVTMRPQIIYLTKPARTGRAVKVVYGAQRDARAALADRRTFRDRDGTVWREE